MTEIDLGPLSDFPEGDYRIFAVEDLEVGVFHRQGKLIAYENACPHFGGPVCQGKVINRVQEDLLPDKRTRGLQFSRDEHVVCPWHGYEFNLVTGQHPGDPTVQLTRVTVSVRDDRVWIQMPD